jgi:tetratricopeptide (TPR) repeat protein
MSQNIEKEPFRTRLKNEVGNFLQKYRGLLLGLVAAAVIVTAGLTLWTQVDTATKVSFAAQIERSQADFLSWQAEPDAAKKAVSGAALEKELAEIQKNAPKGYGLSKAWFIEGNYFASQKKWTQAAKAFRTVFEKDQFSYLAPIALLNAAVSQEEGGEIAEALNTYGEFEKAYANDSLLSPQVFFTQGRLLEVQLKPVEAVVAYKKLLEKFPESSWTKLGRDRIISLNPQ